jgi:hypothetical protein
MYMIIIVKNYFGMVLNKIYMIKECGIFIFMLTFLRLADNFKLQNLTSFQNYKTSMFCIVPSNL